MGGYRRRGTRLPCFCLGHSCLEALPGIIDRQGALTPRTEHIRAILRTGSRLSRPSSRFVMRDTLTSATVLPASRENGHGHSPSPSSQNVLAHISLKPEATTHAFIFAALRNKSTSWVRCARRHRASPISPRLRQTRTAGGELIRGTAGRGRRAWLKKSVPDEHQYVAALSC